MLYRPPRIAMSATSLLARLIHSASMCRSTFVGAGEPASGGYWCGQGGEEGAGSGSLQFRSVNGADRFA